MAYYYFRPRKSITNGITVKSRRGPIGTSWWSKRFLGCIDCSDSGRMSRGKSYARSGQVYDLSIEKGIITAKVQGSHRNPYEVKIEMDTITDSSWDDAFKGMATDMLLVPRLLGAQMSDDIETHFKNASVSLVPSEDENVETYCTCPDYANPCKHIAAVFFVLAEQFDENPFLMFKLRGRDKDEVIAGINLYRPGANQKGSFKKRWDVVNPDIALATVGEDHDYWHMKKEIQEPAYDLLHTDPTHLHRQLGAAPFSIEDENMAYVLAKAYMIASKAARKRLGGNDVDLLESDDVDPLWAMLG